jgi:excisionase family DNA binding protein
MPELTIRIWTAEQVAKLLECTQQTVEIAAREGRLPGIQYGRAWLFPEDALMEALRLEALANLKLTRSPAPVPEKVEEAFTFTAVPARRKAANNSRTRPRPHLPPLTG